MKTAVPPVWRGGLFASAKFRVVLSACRSPPRLETKPSHLDTDIDYPREMGTLGVG